MSDSDRGQVIQSAAEVYDQFFVPALFGEWAPRVADAAQVQPGQRVLDVATGTGVLARVIAERVGDQGSVTGMDINEGMLAVARRAAPYIEWRQAAAEEIPFDTGLFDAVVSQFGLMFFQNREAAIREMMRVLRRGGRLVVAVWGSINASPGYADLAVLLKRLYGKEAAESLYAPFNLADVDALHSLFEAAGVPQAQITTLQGMARFPSLEAWMYTEIKGWTLADMIDDEQFDQLLKEAPTVFQRYITRTGGVEFPVPAHIITAAAY